MLFLFSHSSKDHPCYCLLPGVWCLSGTAVYPHSQWVLLAEKLLSDHLKGQLKKGRHARPTSCEAASLSDEPFKGHFHYVGIILLTPIFSSLPRARTSSDPGTAAGPTDEWTPGLLRSPRHSAGFSFSCKEALYTGGQREMRSQTPTNLLPAKSKRFQGVTKT